MIGKEYSLLDYANYVTFFPQLIAGPIVTHDELIPQFLDINKKKIDWNNISRGLYLFSCGMAKKILLADRFGNVVNYGYDHIQTLNSINAIIVMLAYTIQIYFDFSGYCDMAIGIGKMFNIELPINFDSPYKSLTIIEFWKRWHITLTRFLTRYIYIPCGGNRKGVLRTYINIFIVFLISGFWHGAGVTFIIWGIGHGIFSIITRIFKRFFDNLHPVLNWIITFGFISIMWIFFRSDSIWQAKVFIKKIICLDFGAIDTNITACFRSPLIKLVFDTVMGTDSGLKLYFLLYFLLVFIIILGCKNAYEKTQSFKPNVTRLIYSAILMVWSILSFSGVSTFLYFNF